MDEMGVGRKDKGKVRDKCVPAIGSWVNNGAVG